MIVLVAVLTISAQGKKTRNIFLLNGVDFFWPCLAWKRRTQGEHSARADFKVIFPEKELK